MAKRGDQVVEGTLKTNTIVFLLLFTVKKTFFTHSVGVFKHVLQKL